MADYMLLVLEDEDLHAAQSPAAMAALIEKRAQFVDGLRRAGHLRDSGRFRPSKEGKRVRRGDQLQVEGGPLVYDGKALGAYYWVQADSVEEAARLAIDCPTLASDDVDVRPVKKAFVASDEVAKQGKIFGFVVLGNAATEEDWVKVMERTGAEPQTHFAGSFLGGVRLESPKAGRRVAARGERRAMFDGPFLESKE